jgi:hypothetical protein
MRMTADDHLAGPNLPQALLQLELRCVTSSEYPAWTGASIRSATDFENAPAPA